MEAVGSQLTTMVPFGSGVEAGRSNVSFFHLEWGSVCPNPNVCGVIFFVFFFLSIMVKLSDGTDSNTKVSYLVKQNLENILKFSSIHLFLWSEFAKML